MASLATSGRLPHRETNTWARRGQLAVDAGFMFGVILLIELALPGSASLSELRPHPFWIPVLLMTVRYGSHAGLATSASAIVLMLIFLRPERDPHLDYYAFGLNLFLEPVLWLATALILGQIVDRHISERRALDAELASALNQRDVIAQHSQILGNRLEEIERQIATRGGRSVAEGLTALSNVRNASPPDVWMRLEQAAETLFGPCILSAHMIGGPKFKNIESRTLSCGEVPSGHMRADPTASRALITSVSERKEVFSIFNEKDAPFLEQTIFAAPLWSEERNQVVGVLCLNELHPNALDRWAEYAFSTMANELAQSLCQSQALCKDNYDPEHAAPDQHIQAA